MANRPIQVYNPLWNGTDTANTYHPSGSGGMSGIGACQTVTSGSTDPSSLGFTGLGCILQWCKISLGGLGNGNAGGLYRLVVEATGLDAATSDYTSSSLDRWGQHSYSLKICDDPAATTPINCGNGSWASGNGEIKTAPLGSFGWRIMCLNFPNS